MTKKVAKKVLVNSEVNLFSKGYSGPADVLSVGFKDVDYKAFVEKINIIKRITESERCIIKALDSLKFNDSKKILILHSYSANSAISLSSIINKNDLLVINESQKKRINNPEDLPKWGIEHTVIFKNAFEEFANFEGIFDLIYIDFRFAENEISKSKNQQSIITEAKNILSAASLLSSKGGKIIFSDDKNEIFETINPWFKRTFMVSELNLDDKNDQINIAAYEQIHAKTTTKNEKVNFHKLPSTLIDKIVPFVNAIQFADYEVFRENNGRVFAIHKSHEAFMAALYNQMQMGIYGLELGIFKADDFFPSSSLLFSDLVNKELEKIEMSKAEFEIFLKNDQNNLPKKNGFISYQNQILGWLAK